MYAIKPSIHRPVGLLAIQAICLVSLSINIASAQESQNGMPASSQRQAQQSYREEIGTAQGAYATTGAGDRTKLVLNEVPTTTTATTSSAQVEKSKTPHTKKRNFDDNFSSLDGNMPVGGI